MLKKILSFLVVSLLSVSLCGCSFSLDSLMGNSEDTEVNRDKKYEKWNEGKTLPLEGYVVSMDAELNGYEVEIKRGVLKKKGISYFAVLPWFNMYSKQGVYYLDLNDQKLQSNISDTDELNEIYNMMIPDLTLVEVVDSSYNKTITKEDVEYDIIDVISYNYKEKEEVESGGEEEGDGNGVSVVISDGKDEVLETIPIELQVYVNAETGEIWKIKYPINDQTVTFNIEDLELPKKLSGDEISSEEWMNVFYKTVTNLK